MAAYSKPQLEVGGCEAPSTALGRGGRFAIQMCAYPPEPAKPKAPLWAENRIARNVMFSVDEWLRR
jgi:hypothetical protein